MNNAPFRGHDGQQIELKRAERLRAVQKDAPRYLPTFQRAYAGNSLRAAVNAFCVECNGFDAAAVRECTAPACPLWPYRPGGRREHSGPSSVDQKSGVNHG
jgi:hypothetical protein